MFKLYVFIVQILALICLALSFEPVDVFINDGIGEGLNNVDTKSFTKIGNGYYFISDVTKVNWFEAYEKCRLMGAELVTFESVEEWNAVTKYLTEQGKRNEFWTSGNSNARDGMYMWFKNGQPISIGKWAPRQPDNAGGREHCIHMGYIYKDSTLYQLNDRPCNNDSNSLFNFICEAEPQTVSILIWK